MEEKVFCVRHKPFGLQSDMRRKSVPARMPGALLYVENRCCFNELLQQAQNGLGRGIGLSQGVG